MFQSLCGQEALKSVLLTTTQWSNINPAEGQAREDNLRDEGLRGGLLARAPLSRIPRHQRIRIRAYPQVERKCINEELIAREKKFKKKVESLEKQFREVIKAKGEEMKAMGDEMRALEDVTLLGHDCGKVFNNRLIAQENALKEQLESLEKKLQEVMGGMDHEVKTVMEEQVKTQNKLERLQLKRKTLLAECNATGI